MIPRKTGKPAFLETVSATAAEGCLTVRRTGPYNYAYYLDFPTINMSRSGDKTDDLLRRFDADVLPFHVRYLLIMGGTNNLRCGERRKRSFLTWKLFRKNAGLMTSSLSCLPFPDRPGSDLEILPAADGRKLESGI